MTRADQALLRIAELAAVTDDPLQLVALARLAETLKASQPTTKRVKAALVVKLAVHRPATDAALAQVALSLAEDLLG